MQHKKDSLFESAYLVLNEAKTPTPKEAALLKMVVDNSDIISPKVKTLGYNLSKELTKPSFDTDDDGFLHIVCKNIYVYLLTKSQVKTGGFGESDNELIVKGEDGMFFVVVAV